MPKEPDQETGVDTPFDPIPDDVVKSFVEERDLERTESPRYIYKNTTQGTLFVGENDPSADEIKALCFEVGFPVLVDRAERFETTPSLRVGGQRIRGAGEIKAFLGKQARTRI